MTPYYTDPLVTLLHGDCIEVLAEFEADSVDAVVTDPPYALEFMGRAWDSFGGRGESRSNATAAFSEDGMGKGFKALPSYLGGLNPRCKTCGKSQRGGSPCKCESPNFTNEIIPRMLAFQAWCEQWGREALRVTKPGGYLLAFGGTRTHHRLVCALEDAGWIIRDELDWIYASGFPKGKANLKPAHEPIVLARKPGPLRPLGIDECRIPSSDNLNGGAYSEPSEAGSVRRWEGGAFQRKPGEYEQPAGRWPSNVLLSSPELFDEPNPYVVGSGATTNSNVRESEDRDEQAATWSLGRSGVTLRGHEDSGGYSRFFALSVRMDGRCQYCGVVNAESSSSATTTPATPSDSTPEIVRSSGSDGTDPSAESAASLSSTPTISTAPPNVPMWADEGSGSSSEHPSTSDSANGSSKSSDGSTTSTPRSKRPATSPRSTSPSGPATSAEAPETSSVTTTTTPSRWTCDACVALATHGFTLAGTFTGAEDFLEERASPPEPYPRHLIVPKADRAERERGLKGTTDGSSVLESGTADMPAPEVDAGGQAGEVPVLHQASHETRAESAFSIVCAKCNRQKVNVPGAACQCSDPEWVRKSRTARLNLHPTVKPIDLMRHLIRLVTPTDGLILDPFLGSGTTALAASEEGFRCIGIERELEYLEIAKGRLMATPMGLGLGVEKSRPIGEEEPVQRGRRRGGFGNVGAEKGDPRPNGPMYNDGPRRPKTSPKPVADTAAMFDEEPAA
jgi:DNA modification methylase